MKSQTVKYSLASDSCSKEQKDVLNRQVPTLKNKDFKPLKPLKSIDNITSSKQIKERSFIPSHYKAHHHPNHERQQQQQYKHSQPSNLSIIQHSFNSVNSPHRIEITNQRPTMGGKTIGAIRSDCTKKGHKRLSSQELKLLSRRIDPNEPLSSPHASPSKPPLPNLSRKRSRLPSPKLTSNKKTTNVNNSPRQFICEPCNKRYKNRNGLMYHQERCKYRKEQQQQQQQQQHQQPEGEEEEEEEEEEETVLTTMQCICLFPTILSKPVIKCKNCNTFLHQNCLGEVQQTDDYCCPRCNDKLIESHLSNNRLLDLTDTKETGDTLQHNLKETQLENKSENQDSTATKINNDDNSNLDFIHPFVDENNGTTEEAELQECDPIIWDLPTDLSGTWYLPDVPSLLFSSDACPSSSTLEDDSLLASDATFDLPSDFTLNNELPSDFVDFPSSPLQPDWLDFANFEDDFTC